VLGLKIISALGVRAFRCVHEFRLSLIKALFVFSCCREHVVVFLIPLFISSKYLHIGMLHVRK
jgi:hypothetical protein